jgi:sugar phosphate isomerase/epimerase
MKRSSQTRLLLTVCAALALPAFAEVPIPEANKVGGFAIGCQAYTFNRFTAFEAIEKSAAAGARVIEFYPGQKLSKEEPTLSVGHDSSDEVVQKLKEKLAKHNMVAVNYGVVSIPKDEAAARKIFEFAKKMGMYGVTTESVDALDTIEKLVKEFDITCAIHNHPRQPNNPNYKVWDPNYVLSVVKDRDRRIGSCADTGHWLTSGIDPLEAVKILKGRIMSSHMKDRNVRGDAGHHDVPFGAGVAGLPAILDELKAQGFKGNISIEYEYNWDASVTDVAQCIGFFRGYAAARK